jgi:hypothetical protein
MRWNKPSNIMIGQTRKVRKFLWIPVWLEDQVRWLEFAEIVQQRVEWAHVTDDGIVVPEPGWKDIHWSNK